MFGLNPWLIVGAMLIVSGLCAGSYKAGRDHKENEMRAGMQREAEIVAGVQLAVADQVARIKVVNQTVYQKAVHEVLRETVYRDCVHSPGGLSAVNAALENKPADSGELPGTHAAQ
jgi:hypothetical protein